MQKVIVTGATGLIGSHLVVELLRTEKYRITALLRSESSKQKLTEILERHNYSEKDLDYVIVDTSNYTQLKEAVSEFDIVFHCAAIVSFKGSSAEQIVSNNVELTNYVVDSCLSSRLNPLLVHISSIAALGTAQYPELTTEQTPFTNIATASAYSRSKFLSENEVWRGIKQGLNAVIVSPSVVLGAGATASEGLQPVFRMASRGISFYTDGVVGYVDVVDVARAMILVTQDSATWNRRYILSGYNLTYKELITSLNSAFGHRAPRFKVSKLLLRITVAFLYVVQRNPLLSRDMISFLTNKSAYDGSQIKKITSFKYTPLATTTSRIALESNIKKQ